MEHYKLSDISLGQANGETESANSKFIDMFYTGNNKYNELLDKNKFIISGRKGTGKTVLAKYFIMCSEQADPLLVTNYTKLKNVGIHELIEFGDKKIDRKNMFYFQRFLIYKEIASSLVNKKKKLKDFNFKLLSYLKYLNRYSKLKKTFNLKYKNRDLFEIVELQKREITTVTDSGNLSAGNGEISSGSEHQSYRGETKKVKEFYKLVDYFEEMLMKVLNYVNAIMIIDDLDDYFIDDKGEMIRYLIDIVNNVHDINMNCLSRSKNSRCILLLRNDVIDSFASRDANIQKVLSDCQVKLEWLEDHNGLKNMLGNKILNSNSIFKNCTINELTNYYFPIAKSKGKRKGKSFVVEAMSYGFGRPRDIIMLLNIIISDNSEEEGFTFDMIKKAQSKYSKDFIAEIKNEMNFHFEAEYIEMLFKVLAEFKKTRFNFSEFEEFLKQYSYDDKPLEAIEILDNMYKFGIVGYLPIGYSNKYYSWSYFPNATPNITKNLTFVIHKGIRKGLNI